jgi:parallel beta-helix repeat protein
MADGKRLYPYQSLTDLQNLIWGVPGFYSSGTSVYVRLEGNANPNTRIMLVSRFNNAFTIEQSFIVIKNLTFRHYGQGDYAKALYFNNASNNLVEGCTFQVNDLGIGIKRESHRNAIQDNTFFDTDFDWPWDAVKSGSGLETGGIRMYEPMTGRGTVIRRNTFHDYFDGFGVCPDSTAGVTNETDIYENLVYNAGDDGVETDGQCSNVRIWGNTFHDVLVGISLAPVYTGPVYALRNLVYRTGAGNNDYPGSPFKFNSGYDPSGPIFLFHNTADAVLPEISGLDIKSPGSWKMIYSRNNIWSGTNFALENSNPTEPLNLDYDCLYTTQAGELVWWDGLSDRHLNTIEELRSVTGQELHGINALPGFNDPVSGNYSLSGSSTLINKGVFIPGINDGFSGTAPDMGAFEFLSGPVNGICGTANGGTFDTAPVSGLCGSGTPSAVTGTAPWNWTCQGISGGTDAQCSAGINHYTLTVNKTGSGNGDVTPESGSFNWVGSTGTGSWPYNSPVILTASHDSLSTFGGWSGACIPSGVTCTATVTANKDVSIEFVTAPKAKIGNAGYTTIFEAYDSASISTKTTIKTLDTDLAEALIMDKGKEIILMGGYNSDYNARTGIPTTLNGVTVATGSLTVDRLAIR